MYPLTLTGGVYRTRKLAMAGPRPVRPSFGTRDLALGATVIARSAGEPP
jgi:hypothetical protein